MSLITKLTICTISYFPFKILFSIKRMRFNMKKQVKKIKIRKYVFELTLNQLFFTHEIFIVELSIYFQEK